MAIEWNISPVIGGRCSTRPDDVVIAELAARQHGVVARGQLLALGVGARAIEHRIAHRRLHPIHRGVYAVGHAVRTRDATWMAAALAAGPDAVLSHRSAAAIWAIRQSSRVLVEVITPRKLRRPRIEAHRIVLEPDEVTIEHALPVTTPARTLFDLAAVVPLNQLEHAFNEAEYRRLGSPTSLEALLGRYPRHRGTTNLRRVLEDHRKNGQTVTRSVLERRFGAFLDAYDLPKPRTNRSTDQGELDATWPEHRLVVEVDGWAAHGTRKAFEDDRRRDRALVVAGWRVIRLTWRQLDEEPAAIAVQLRGLLG